MSSPPHYDMSDNPFKGPDDGDPLTSEELRILLAIPRAAQTSPDSLAFRLPLGPDPTQGWIDVTYSQTYAIVSRLASTWKPRLDALLSEANHRPYSAGPGTTVCMFVQPGAYAIFHYLAFRALGCTMQYVYACLSEEEICLKLRDSNCHAVLHCGMSDAWINGIGLRFSGKLIALPPEEYAHQLAQDEREGRVGPAPAWPEPRRPTPALILHSSGTTGASKLIRFSLFWYTLAPPQDNGKVTPARACSETSHASSKSDKTRPWLIFSPHFWGSYHSNLVMRLVTATPVAFCHLQDAGNLPPKQLIPWARALDVGSIACSPCFLHELSIEEFEEQAGFLASLSSIVLIGRPVDDSMSALYEKHRLRVINIYGSSESGRILMGNTPPYTHLRKGSSAPLMLPISEQDLDGSRQVQLWLPLSNTPRLAHFYARGGVPMKFEPFPGEGPHKGELALNTCDIFREFGDGESGFAYVYLGRGDDIVRLAGFGQVNASLFETEFISMVHTRYKEGLGGRWMIDAIPLFGNALPYTALVIQLCPPTQGEGTLEQEVLDGLHETVEELNEKMRLGSTRVDAKTRMVVITPEGEVYGPNPERVRGCRLEVTHKHSLQRWKNVQTFNAWLIDQTMARG